MNLTSKQWQLSNKNILISGSSRGIGFHTALGLAQRGAHVILVSHSEDRLENAVMEIEKETGKGTAQYYTADLSSQNEVRNLAEQIKQDYEHLDVLINNVGGWFSRYQESEDGIEMTFALNNLSYFLLTGLLLELMEKSTPARIINVASDAHKGIDRIHFEDIGFEKNYRSFQTYAQSKLANVMFTYELADRLAGSGITVNALHPGGVATDLYRNFGLLSPIITTFLKIFAKTPEEGAETPIFLATKPELSDVTGKYFADKEQRRSSYASLDKESWSRLWQVSKSMTAFNYLIN